MGSPKEDATRLGAVRFAAGAAGALTLAFCAGVLTSTASKSLSCNGQAPIEAPADLDTGLTEAIGNVNAAASQALRPQPHSPR